MTKPVRLRLSRAKGFDLQAHSRSVNGLECVNVARPSSFGNPFVVGARKDYTRQYCVQLFAHVLNGLVVCVEEPPMREQQLARAAILGNIGRLTGKNLACWCKLDGKPCHADILLDLANDPAKIAICNRVMDAAASTPSPRKD